MTDQTGVNPLLAGLLGRCPHCGEGPLFNGFLSLTPACTTCGFDLAHADSGDGPAVFVILGLGAIVMGLVLFVEIRYEPPIWVHLMLWLPLTFFGAVWMLRVMKAWLIAQQYTHRRSTFE